MTLYLTQIRLHPAEVASFKLFDAYTRYQMLAEAFPDTNRNPRPFLTRVDRYGDNYNVLILSPQPPEPQPWGHWVTKPVAENFFQYERYRFALRANPTKVRIVRDTEGNRRKHCRTGIVDSAQLRRWITRKLRQAGSEPLEVFWGPAIRETFWRKRTINLIRVDFYGVLRVVDRPRFVAAAANGLGRAKAFGFGMLLLAPLS